MANAIVAAARGWIGTPYRHQASLKGVGCDCLGLIRGVWREVIGAEPQSVPPYAPDWSEASSHEALYEAGRRHFVEIAPGTREAGDVLLFRWRAQYPAKHLAIVSGANHMIHAHDGASVAEVYLGRWWLGKIAFCFRFPPV